MIRLNRTTEYGLIALRHIYQKQINQPSELTSAREISDTYGLPFEITAKTLQRLKELGIIQSTQGARGGYTFDLNPETIHLGQFIEWMEGSASIVSCIDHGHDKNGQTKLGACEYQSKCGIQQLMGSLNHRIHNFLSEIPLTEFLAERIPNYVTQ